MQIVLAVTFEVDDAVLDGGALGGTEAQVAQMLTGAVRTQVSALRFLRSVTATQVWPLPPAVQVHNPEQPQTVPALPEDLVQESMARLKSLMGAHNPDYIDCVMHIEGELAVEWASCPVCEARQARWLVQAEEQGVPAAELLESLAQMSKGDGIREHLD